MFVSALIRLKITQIYSCAWHAVISVPKPKFCKVLRHFYLEFEYEIAGSRLLRPSLRLHEGGGRHC
jgi:hypothetical protein